VREGRWAEVLHSFEPAIGDCVFIPAGTVHAIGAGLIVAEIQQSSDVTYRLYDWDRTAADGRPRPLHIDAGLEAVTQFATVAPVRWETCPSPSGSQAADPASRRLVSCNAFLFDEVRPAGDWAVGGDDSCHVLAVVSGDVHFAPEWQLPPLTRGSCCLMPAAIGRQVLSARADANGNPVLLHVQLP